MIKVKLELLTSIDTLLMVEKGIRWRICHSINRYKKTNNKYTKDYGKNKGSSYLKYWDIYISNGWPVSNKPPLNGFEWSDYIWEFDEGFIKS